MKHHSELGNVVSIAGRPPVWYKGRQYKKLAPKYWFFAKYKEDGDADYYVEQYYYEVLAKLDAQQVYEELGENAILCCWEDRGFCHRFVVADWFKVELGIIIEELDDK